MKVTIVGGAGGVGSAVAFNLLLLGRDYDIVLVDPRQKAVAFLIMDLGQVLEQRPGGSVRTGDEDDLRDSDLVVVAAGTPLTPNTSRLVYLGDHAPIIARIAEVLGGAGSTWQGVLVMVTNPVDPLCTLLHRSTGLDRRRILGYTFNDSLRLRTGIGHVLGVSPGTVEAWVLGEHGDTNVPLLDRVSVAGEPVQLAPEQRATVEKFVRTWYARAVALSPNRSTVWTSGIGVARMLDAVAFPNGELWPASVVLTGEYGVDGASVGVPVTLGRGGAEQIHEWELGASELAALQRSATLVRGLTDGVDAARRRRYPAASRRLRQLARRRFSRYRWW